jgi:sortase A
MLFIVGMLIVAWCAFAWVRAEYYDRLPIPVHEPAVIAVLPGEGVAEDGESAASGTSGLRSPTRPGTWLARLEGPADLQATVLEGSDRGTLAKAAGHIENTARPGEQGNIGIAGHRDTVFRPLRHIQEGDVLRLTTAGATYTYRVARTSIVDPHEVHVLAPTDEPTLTLVTCYPFTFIGAAPSRFIVHARLIQRH